jgi:hypothetical protein
MNPRRFTQFLRSRFGLFLVFVAALFIGVWFFGRHQMRDRQVARMAPQAGTRVDLGQVSEPLGRGLEGGVPRRAAVRRSAEGGIVPFNPPAASAKVAKGATEVPPKPKKVRYESLLASYEAPAVGAPVAPPPPKRFMPFGTLLKCKLVNTVDSADIETPVIALLLEDVWQDGELVIPANTLVHGTARAGRIRDRINASGTWRFVWQDGRELAFSGIALDREYDQDVDGYGITDGSGGLKGRVMATDDFQELKMLAAAAMSGFAQGTQDRIVNGYGVTIPGSVTNGLWQGAGTVFQTYAQRTLQDIQQNGYYVRVAAGKEFYVYVLGMVDPDNAKIAGASVPPVAATTNSPPARAILTSNLKE